MELFSVDLEVLAALLKYEIFLGEENGSIEFNFTVFSIYVLFLK